MVGSYPVMAIPLAFLINRMRTWSLGYRYAGAAILVLCVVLNLFQYWQFNKGLIHASRMTAAAYFASFAKTAPPVGTDRLLLVDRSAPKPPIEPTGEYAVIKVLGDFTCSSLLNTPGPMQDSITAPCRSEHIDPERPFSAAFKARFSDLTAQDHAWLELRWLVHTSSETSGNVLVNTFDHDGSYAYQTNDVLDLGAHHSEWTLIRQWYLTPEVRSRSDQFAAYAWSTQGKPMEVIGPLILVHEATGIQAGP